MMDEKIEQLAKDLKLIKELQASDIYTANYQEAIVLFSLGYRKADEVRKETAEEILQKIIEKDHKILAWEYGVGYMDCMKNLKSVISEYGVEVE